MPGPGYNDQIKKKHKVNFQIGEGWMLTRQNSWNSKEGASSNREKIKIAKYVFENVKKCNYLSVQKISNKTDISEEVKERIQAEQKGSYRNKIALDDKTLAKELKRKSTKV